MCEPTCRDPFLTGNHLDVMLTNTDVSFLGKRVYFLLVVLLISFGANQACARCSLGDSKMVSNMSNKLSCRICGGQCEYDDRGGLSCRQCYSLIVKEVPGEDVLSSYYLKFNDQYSGGGSSRGKNQPKYARRYLKYTQTYTKNGALLDIGCSNNPFPNYAKEAGFSVTAMDYVRPSELLASVTFMSGSLNDEKLLDMAQKFDVVTAWAVIEHVANPELAFKILSSLTHKNGYVHLVTPEHGTWSTRFAAGKTRWFYPPEHIHLLSSGAMAILAKRNGLKLVAENRVEISNLRWVIRYAIGFLEGVFGIALLKFVPKYWDSLRVARCSKYIGIKHYVFKRI